jgi:hypothetical protein
MRVITKVSVLGLFSSALLAACGSGSGGSGNTGSCENIAGEWDSTELVDGLACPDSATDTRYRTYKITQSGCAITVAVTGPVAGVTFTGTISGTHLSWAGSFPDGSGTTTITGMDLTLSDDKKSVSGTASWTWTGSGTSCSGTTSVTATKEAHPGDYCTMDLAPVTPTGSCSTIAAGQPVTIRLNTCSPCDDEAPTCYVDLPSLDSDHQFHLSTIARRCQADATCGAGCTFSKTVDCMVNASLTPGTSYDVLFFTTGTDLGRTTVTAQSGASSSCTL